LITTPGALIICANTAAASRRRHSCSQLGVRADRDRGRALFAVRARPRAAPAALDALTTIFAQASRTAEKP
jgi:hypothetical protein